MNIFFATIVDVASRTWIFIFRWLTIFELAVVCFILGLIGRGEKKRGIIGDSRCLRLFVFFFGWPTS